MDKALSKQLDIHHSSASRYYKAIFNGVEKELRMRFGKHFPAKYDKELVERKEDRSAKNFEPDGENKSYGHKTANSILDEKIFKMYVL